MKHKPAHARRPTRRRRRLIWLGTSAAILLLAATAVAAWLYMRDLPGDISTASATAAEVTGTTAFSAVNLEPMADPGSDAYNPAHVYPASNSFTIKNTSNGTSTPIDEAFYCTLSLVGADAAEVAPYVRARVFRVTGTWIGAPDLFFSGTLDAAAVPGTKLICSTVDGTPTGALLPMPAGVNAGMRVNLWLDESAPPSVASKSFGTVLHVTVGPASSWLSW